MTQQTGGRKTFAVFIVVIAVIVAATLMIVFYIRSTALIGMKIKEEKAPARVAGTMKTEPIQIYPNYEFPEGVSQIRVPLIPSHYQLPREAGGWVTVPIGSYFRRHFEVPIVVEYIDGRKFRREPNKPAWDGVEADNGMFRLYGQEGKYATVAIKRGVY